MNEEGTTNVLGAVLVVALLFTVMANVETNFRPIWDEDAEAAHLSKVLNQFADLKAETEKQTQNRTRAPVSNPLLLEPPSSKGIFKGRGVTGDLSFTPQTINTTMFSPAISIIERNGEPLGLLNEDWETAVVSADIDEVERLDSLRLRIIKDSDDDKFEFEKNMFVKLEITDANGDFGGWFKAYVPNKEKHDIWVEVVTAQGEVLVNQEIASDVKYKEHTTFWIDTLDPSWPFQQVIDAAATPYKLTLTYDWNSNDDKKTHIVEYSSAYLTTSQAGQEVFIGGQGSTINNYLKKHNGGRLSYHIPYKHMPEVDIVLEHGALIISQPQGNSMAYEPQFDVELSGTQTLIKMSNPIYRGERDNVGGRSSVMAVTSALHQESIIGTVADVQFTIETDFPDVWASFMDGKLRDAGLVAPEHYTIYKYTDSVEVNVKGLSSSSTHDVQLNTHNSIINVEFR